jgi:hypothetical protein
VRLEGLVKLKKSSDLIRNRARDLSPCSIMPQPTTLPRALCNKIYGPIILCDEVNMSLTNVRFVNFNKCHSLER